MRKRTIWSIVATVAIVLMVSAMIPITTAQGPLTNTMGKSAQPVNDEFGVLTNGTANTSFTQADLAKLIADVQSPLFGIWNVSGNNANGNYVSFMVDNSTGAIMNYSLMTSTGQKVVLLNSIEGTGFHLSDWSAKGSLLVASNGESGMAIHDSPEGTMHMASTTGADLNLTLAPGLSVATAQSSLKNMNAWMITGNGVSCVLMVYNGTVTQGAGNQTANQTTPMTPVTNTTKTPTTPGNVTTQPVCSIKLADANTTNQTNMTGLNKTTAGTRLNIALHNDSFVVLRAIPIGLGFSAANELAISSAILNGMVNTEMSIMSATAKATTNPTGNLTANLTTNQTVSGPMNTMWSTVEYFNHSLTQVTNAARGNVSIEIAPFAAKATTPVSNVTGNVTGNQTAGNVTAGNQTTNQTSNATVNLPKLWVISIDDTTLGAMNMSPKVMLDGKTINQSASIIGLTTVGTNTASYFMASGTNATMFVVNIPDPSMNHTLVISSPISVSGGNATSNITSSNSAATVGASGVEYVVGIGIIGIAAIAAAMLVVRNKK